MKTYVRTLLNINTGCSTSIQTFCRSLDIPIQRRVWQGDTISPLHHLGFADDIVLFAPAVRMAEMLNELNEVGTSIGLRINEKKTQAMKLQIWRNQNQWKTNRNG